MTKLQCSVSQEFLKLEPAIQKAALEKDPTQKPPKLNNLIPTALLYYAGGVFGMTIDQDLRDEAAEILTRKPGPQKKKTVESHDLFDERPGTWLSNVAIATGCAMVTCKNKSLSLAGYHLPSTAVVAALDAGWGAIPEAKKTQNNPDHPGLPGIRFIPPGTDLAPKATPAPAPMTLADVGVWIAESSVLQCDRLVLPDCRIIEHTSQELPNGSIRIPKAIPSGDKPEQKQHAILKAIAMVQSAAYQLGWTMRKEQKNGAPGILLIPPRVKLTYEIAPGRTVPVTQ